MVKKTEKFNMLMIVIFIILIAMNDLEFSCDGSLFTMQRLHQILNF